MALSALCQIKQNQNNMKIGLFGGSFDPIHKGHLHIARAFADELALDNVIFLPAGQPYHKHHTHTNAIHRLTMVSYAIEQDARFCVSNLDIIRQGKTYTIDTVGILKQHYPSAQLWWLMGMDNLLQLHTWKHWQNLVRQTHIAVAARSSQTLNHAPPVLQAWLGEALHRGSLKILNSPQWSISSTEIRQAIQKQQFHLAQTQLPANVWHYIQQHRLYR